jgi:hypothetical protein
VRDRRILIGLGAVVLIAAAAFGATRLGGGEPPAPTPAPSASATPAPATPTPTVEPLPVAGKGLQVGITEFNPNFVATPGTVPLLEPFSHWRDALAAIKPRFFRLMIDWPAIQPQQTDHADLAQYNGGCERTVPPCQPYGGLTDVFKALASRQKEGGWQALVVINGTPAWAVPDPSGCSRAADGTRSRLPRADAVPAYRRLVEDLIAAAAQQGAQLRFWSAWNEPNLHQFLSPQRATCRPTAPSAAPAGYAKLFYALQEALDEAPGDQQPVIGETAGIVRSGTYTTSVQEFIKGLPENVACASTVWSQHGYIGGPDPAPQVIRALDARGCPRRHTVWITETGVVAKQTELSAASAIRDERQGCAALHRRLVRWWREPRVTAAFQYEFRNDDAFPSGLVRTDLSAARPELAEWTAWGGDREPSAPPPASAC